MNVINMPHSVCSKDERLKENHSASEEAMAKTIIVKERPDAFIEAGKKCSGPCLFGNDIVPDYKSSRRLQINRTLLLHDKTSVAANNQTYHHEQSGKKR